MLRAIRTLAAAVREEPETFAERHRAMHLAEQKTRAIQGMMEALKRSFAELKRPKDKEGDPGIKSNERRSLLVESIKQMAARHPLFSESGLPEDELAELQARLTRRKPKAVHVENELARLFFGNVLVGVVQRGQGLKPTQRSFEPLLPGVEFMASGNDDLKGLLFRKEHAAQGGAELRDWLKYMFSHLRNAREHSLEARNAAVEHLKHLASHYGKALAFEELPEILANLAALHEHTPVPEGHPAEKPNPWVYSVADYLIQNRPQVFARYLAKAAQYIKDGKHQAGVVPVRNALQAIHSIWSDTSRQWVLPRSPRDLKPIFEKLTASYKANPVDTAAAVDIVRRHANERTIHGNRIGHGFMDHVEQITRELVESAGNKEIVERRFLNQLLPPVVAIRERRVKGPAGSRPSTTVERERLRAETRQKVDDLRRQLESLRKQQKPGKKPTKGKRKSLQAQIKRTERELKKHEDYLAQLDQGIMPSGRQTRGRMYLVGGRLFSEEELQRRVSH